MSKNVGALRNLDGTLYPNYRLNVRLLPFIIKEGRFLSAFSKARKIIRREQAEGGLFANVLTAYNPPPAADE
ncbi:MAG: hypothetical protein FWC06_06435 [Treponema sp.]|nr:hypothetical protein [Treponema sp.]